MHSHCKLFLCARPQQQKNMIKKMKKIVSVACPNEAKVYNAHMGGVDIADMLTALYRIHMKTRRWYMSINAQKLDIALNNSLLLYRRNCKPLTNENKLSLKKKSHPLDSPFLPSFV